MKQKDSFYNHLWFLWIVLTSIYLLSGITHLNNWVTGLFGLFVPFGIWNTYASITLNGLLTFPLLLLSFWGADAIALKLKITNFFTRALFNLVWLLVLTLAVDLILWNGQWMSLNILLYCPSSSDACPGNI